MDENESEDAGDPTFVDAGEFEVRGVRLGGKKASAEIMLTNGDVAFTILTSDAAARALGPMIGRRVVLCLEPV